MKKLSCYLLLVLLFLTCSCNKTNSNGNFYDGEITKNPISTLEAQMTKEKIEFEKIPFTSNNIGALECYYYYLGEEQTPLIVYYFDEKDDNYKNIISKGHIEIKALDTVDTTEIIYSKGLIIEKNTNLSHFNKIEKILNNI